LTHVVDEVALTCGEVRHGMSGAAVAEAPVEKTSDDPDQEQTQVLAPPSQQ
jgi:hypothetical protein